MTEWLRRVWHLLNRRRDERELEREMAAHRALMGEPRRFGNTLRLREEARDVWGWSWLDDFVRDLRYALRTLARSPGFTVAAILTLALGIGANTAIFSLIETVLLRTVAVEAPHELVFLAHRAGERISTGSNYPYFERVRARTDVFAGVTAYSGETFKVQAGDAVEMISGQFVSGNYHAVLGVRFALGRGFASGDDRAGAEGLVAVISDRYWARTFGRDPTVLGQTLVVQGRPVSIVGVTAAGFDGLQPGSRFDVTVPLAVRTLDDPTFLTWHDSITSMPIVARVEAGVSEAQALAAVESVLRQYLQEPEARLWRRAWQQQPRVAALLAAARGEDLLRRQYGTALGVLMAIVGIVLAIGCANVATLLLARASARVKEVAVRLSLGARRTRVVRQFLTESLLLAAGGGALGLLLAWWGADVITASVAIGERPFVIDARPNQPVLLFTTGLSMLTVMLFGLAPALGAARVNVTPALKESGAAVGGRGRRWSGRQMLVALQLALCVVLLAGAGLLVRTFWNLKALDVGFDRTNVLMFAVDVEATPLPAERLPQLCDELLERLRGRPGTSAVSCSVSVPVRGSGSTRALTVPGLPPSEDRDAFANQVTPGYFRTFGLALLRGRLLSETDTATSQQVAVISERLAREYFGDEDPIGRTLRFGVREPRDPMTIVGVVGDTFQFNSLRDAPPRIVYTPIEQEYDLPPRVTVAVRSTEPPSALAAAARTEVGAVSRDAVVDYVRTMEQQIDAGLTRERVLATLSLWFGALALALASVGLYGVMSYDIGRRRRDIGIRLALGAEPRTILRQVLLRTGAVAGMGIAGGLVMALAATRLLGGLLYGLGPADPVTLGAGAGALAATALVAGYLPARRAARVNPVVALRAE